MAMQAIRTQYRGPTHNRGSQIMASCSAPGVYMRMPYDDGLSEDANHKQAAMMMLRRLHDKANWPLKTMVAGSHKGDYYWVYQHTNTYITP